MSLGDRTEQASRHRSAELPPVLSGFEHINRYWDDTHGYPTAKILPGEYYVTSEQEMVVTVLGSCVSACIRNTVTGVGGMNHFMLPENAGNAGGSWGDHDVGKSTRYGSHAMERLINDILKFGGRREQLEVKIFGGGRILAQMTDVGRKNVEFVRRYLSDEGLRIAASDVGEIYPRKVYYLPATGKVLVKHLRSMHNDTIIEREMAYMGQIAQKPVTGDITLF